MEGVYQKGKLGDIAYQAGVYGMIPAGSVIATTQKQGGVGLGVRSSGQSTTITRQMSEEELFSMARGKGANAMAEAIAERKQVIEQTVDKIYTVNINAQ
ncbi:hypothetical protein V500_00285 [Pseudogymnoascus sp. VKM F-4518 (FW-2643)]|nr:hypothetical protein V500_00285 [Pseudogymnoascus sp. VKM F-4518 (FW-2643)]